jgi:hypothetical protein
MTNDLPEQDGSCWKSLFRNATIVPSAMSAIFQPSTPVENDSRETGARRYFSDSASMQASFSSGTSSRLIRREDSANGPESKTNGKGIKVPFSMLLQMSSIEYPAIVDGFGLVLVGYRTVLIPEERTKDYIQFHLKVSEDKQINPFKLQYHGTSALQSLEDVRALEGETCYLGWCQEAQIHLASEDLVKTMPKYSDAPEKRRTLQLDGITAGLGISSAAPVQIGGTAQASFVFRSNRLNFTPTSDYSRLIRNTSLETVLLYDSSSKRSWAVSKLDVLLHMCHIWARRHNLRNHRIPFVEPHTDSHTLVNALEDCGENIVCGSGNEKTTLRTLLLGLSINMLRSMQVVAPSGNRELYGFEFLDIVDEPGRGGFMKKLKLTGSGASWSHLATFVDAIIVCSSIGEVITPLPSPTRNSKSCNLLPMYRDYLAITVECIRRIMERRGREFPTVLGGTVSFCDGVMWRVSANPFPDCNHNREGHSTCWTDHDILQSLVLRNGQMNVQNMIHIFARVVTQRPDSPQTDLEEKNCNVFVMGGALVFGKT